MLPIPTGRVKQSKENLNWCRRALSARPDTVVRETTLYYRQPAMELVLTG